MRHQALRLLLACAAWLLAAGCGPSAPSTSLHSAVQAGNYPAVRQHIAARSDLNVKNSSGLTALHVAATKGDLPMVKLLAEGGADVNRPGPSGKTPVAMAREKGKTSIVQYLETRLAGEPAKPSGERRGRGLVDGGLGVSEVLDSY